MLLPRKGVPCGGRGGAKVQRSQRAGQVPARVSSPIWGWSGREVRLGRGWSKCDRVLSIKLGSWDRGATEGLGAREWVSEGDRKLYGGSNIGGRGSSVEAPGLAGLVGMRAGC